MTEASRIRIKYGAIEIEYEGKDSFLKDELPSLIEAISKLAHPPTPTAPLDPKDQPSSCGPAAPLPAITKLAPNSVAAKLGVKTGTDLTLVAAAYLSLMNEKDSFTRQEISDAMKLATGHYKEGYRKNLTPSLQILVKSGKLNEVGANKYTLSATQRATLGGILA